MKVVMDDKDFALALQLDEVLNNEGAKGKPNAAGRTNKPLSIVDPSWELIDPVPDIRELFVQFDAEYFDGLLACVEVKWCPRMTLCAGMCCCYEGRGGLCSIKLSAPLLKLRPRKDLVETLLHEMIHAVLFVTENNKDHDGHGPEFHKHMYRINKETGTNISVYHSFHNEVNEYRQHWWRCNGPCAKRPPYYGIIRRAVDRAPSLRDAWWSIHKIKCGGEFTKIKEPESYGRKGKDKNRDEKQSGNTSEKICNKNKEFTAKSNTTGKSISDYFNKQGNKKSPLPGGSTRSSSTVTVKTNSASTQRDENKIFQSSSDNSSSNTSGLKLSTNDKPRTHHVTSFTGTGFTLGSTNRDVSNAQVKNKDAFLQNIESKRKGNIKNEMCDKTTDPKRKRYEEKQPNQSAKFPDDSTVSIANKRFRKDHENSSPSAFPPVQNSSQHLHDVICIEDDDNISSGCNLVECPACPAKVPEHHLNYHLDKCLS